MVISITDPLIDLVLEVGVLCVFVLLVICEDTSLESMMNCAIATFNFCLFV